MDWNLYRCGRAGHITYAPDEPGLREQVNARTAAGDLWQCVRCSTYVRPGPAHGSGPLAQAPVVRRGKEIRSEIILRVFAIERLIRFVLFGALAFGVFWVSRSQQSIGHTFNDLTPAIRSIFREFGWSFNHSSTVGLLRKALHLSKSTLRWVAVGVAAFAVVELIEGVGLWLAKRWGEYFAAVVTALGLPYEIYDLTAKITATRIVLFIINLALVLYLILTKRLFGARGGKRAYEARLRSESIFDSASRAVAAGQQAPVIAPDSGNSAGRAGSAGPSSAAGPAGSPAPASAVTVVQAKTPDHPESPGGPATPAVGASPVRPADPTLPMRPADPPP